MKFHSGQAIVKGGAKQILFRHVSRCANQHHFVFERLVFLKHLLPIGRQQLPKRDVCDRMSAAIEIDAIALGHGVVQFRGLQRCLRK